MIAKNLKTITLAMGAGLLIPFTPADWTQLKYSSIPSNKLVFTPNQMTIQVKNSASPIFHKLKKTMTVSSLEASGEITGTLTLNEKQQGEKGADDFAVRIGLVVKGQKKLNFAQKLIAPKWINDLYKLAGDTSGVDHIEFINIASQKLNWSKRIHPLSDLLHEEIVQTVNSGSFIINKKFDLPIEVIAIWLSSDGDDTMSNYSVRFNEIKLLEKMK